MNNSLAEVHPELITEWSEKNLPLTPDDITFGSNKKVWWKGTCGHEWQTSVKARSNGEKCPISVIYKKKHTLSGAVIGLASGWLITVIVMLLWNYLVTPLYMGYPRETVVELLLPAFLPFNLLKGGLNASITFLLYKPIVTALRKSGYVATLENEARQKHTGLLILASFIIVTCVLIILSMNRII